MNSKHFTFHHAFAFWSGCLLLTAGVLSHVPMFIMASHHGYHMAGMPMDTMMLVGMTLIPVGLLLSGYGLMPRLEQLRNHTHQRTINFHIADDAALNQEHWKLVIVLFVALAVDVMKPATLGFVMPGMSAEYAINTQTAGWLALVALTGTAIGSVIWGRLADIFGRRAAILLSALMFMGTSICGAMPAFEWNLAMCFLMGASAGGLLPIAFALMAEMIPTKHRGWLLVALGGIGTSAGYLLAAGSAVLLEPLFSWRALWLLGLPTGAAIIFLNRYIPESPRFLVNAGLKNQAAVLLTRFSGVMDSVGDAMTPAGAAHEVSEKANAWQLMRGSHCQISIGLILCGISWGLVNFGFLLWLPSNLSSIGVDPNIAKHLLARSAMFAIPGIPLVTWLYHRWSSVKALVLFMTMTTCSLLAFFLMGYFKAHSNASIIVATASLLVSSSGVIAMLIPYAAEIYPVHLRASGAGVIAESSKFGGIFGAVCGVIGVFNDLSLSALFVAVPITVSAIILSRSGIDTRGKDLEEIQIEVTQKDSRFR